MNNLIKKGVVVAVILLFIGIAFAPSINANVSKTSVDNELVEVTTEVCGLNGGKNTVQLSKEDALEVENLIDDIERRLDEVETREEAVGIFNEAVVELDKYGLLGRLSIEQAQKLTVESYQNSKAKNLLQRLNHRTLEDNENKFCLIAGKTRWTLFWGVLTRALFQLAVILDSMGLGENIINLLIYVSLAQDMIQPFFIGTIIDLYSEGWVWTMGSNGVKSWNGTLVGQIDTLISNHTGAIGFNGLKLNVGKVGTVFYLGFARLVKIEEVE